jgi:hypothetical protein
MIESDLRVITADTIRAVLGQCRKDKMRRAWRNRTPVGQGFWLRCATALLEPTAASLNDRHELAAALYCACGEHIWTDDTFRPESLAQAAWERIAQDTAAYIRNPPEKALSMGQYHARKGVQAARVQGRLNAFCKLFGWQGGTIHQVAERTGCEASSVLDHQVVYQGLLSAYTRGWFAARTNSLAFNAANVFPKEQGNLDFWIGAAEGITIP